MTARAPSGDAPRRWLARGRRAARLAVRAAGRGVIEFYQSSNLTYASSIAYYSLLSLFPFLLLTLSILGRITVGASGETLLQVVAGALPRRFDFLTTQIEEIAGASVQLGVASTILMLWASMGVFGALTSAVNHAWGVEKPHGFFKHKLVSFVMLLAAGALLAAALMLVGGAQVVQARWFAGILEIYPGLRDLTGFVYRNTPTLLFMVVVGLIYYYAPNAKVRLRDVWVGAVLAGLLWRLAFAGFSWFIRDQSRFTVHGLVGPVVAFLVWVYVSAVILLYGVEVTAAYARLRKHLPQEAPAAEARD